MDYAKYGCCGSVNGLLDFALGFFDLAGIVVGDELCLNLIFGRFCIEIRDTFCEFLNIIQF